MARCPEFLRADDFDLLAGSVGARLTDDGVSALGEIAEQVCLLIIEAAVASAPQAAHLTFDDVVSAGNTLGLRIQTDECDVHVVDTVIGEPRAAIA